MPDANPRRAKSLTNEIADLLSMGKGSGRKRLLDELGFVNAEASAPKAFGLPWLALALPPGDSPYEEVIVERLPPNDGTGNYYVRLSKGQGLGSDDVELSRGELADFLANAELGEVSSRVRAHISPPLPSGNHPWTLWSDVGQIHTEDLPPDVAAAAQSILPHSESRQECVAKATANTGRGITYQQVLDAYRACVLGLATETRTGGRRGARAPLKDPSVLVERMQKALDQLRQHHPDDIRTPPPEYRVTVHSPQDVANYIAPAVARLPQEELHVLLLNTRNEVMGQHTVYRGNVNSSVVRPSEVLRPAIIGGAASIIIVHNHPSGDPTPSPEDVSITKEIIDAGKNLGIELLDHVVIGQDDDLYNVRYISMNERDLAFREQPAHYRTIGEPPSPDYHRENEAVGVNLFGEAVTAEDWGRAAESSEAAQEYEAMSEEERREFDRSRAAGTGGASMPAGDVIDQDSAIVTQARAAGPEAPPFVVRTEKLDQAGACMPDPTSTATVCWLTPDDLSIDPETFQYKAVQNAETGETGVLSDVRKWDQDLAGIMYVYEYNDGRKVVADGHQRIGLAKRLQREGQTPILLAKIWREADGITPADMRLMAAKKNIAENSGTAIDAARVLREAPYLADSLSKKGAVSRDGQRLAAMDGEAFEYAAQIANNAQDPARAEANLGLISQHTQNPALQKAMTLTYGREAGREAITQAEANELYYAVKEAARTKTENELQAGLFGDEIQASAWKERAALVGAMNSILEKDKSLFASVVSGDDRLAEAGNDLDEWVNENELEQARSGLATLKVRLHSGPLASYLTGVAEGIQDDVARGMSRKGAARRAADAEIDNLRPYLVDFFTGGEERLRTDMAAGVVSAMPTETPQGQATPSEAANAIADAIEEVREAKGGDDETVTARVTVVDAETGESAAMVIESSPAGPAPRRRARVRAIEPPVLSAWEEMIASVTGAKPAAMARGARRSAATPKPPKPPSTAVPKAKRRKKPGAFTAAMRR